MLKLPTLTCSSCGQSAGKFGARVCSGCKTAMHYEPAHGHPERRFLKSWQSMKFGMWAAIGLLALILLISLLNIGEGNGLAVAILPPAFFALCIVGLQWFRVFIANKYIERNAVHFG